MNRSDSLRSVIFNMAAILLLALCSTQVHASQKGKLCGSHCLHSYTRTTPSSRPDSSHSLSSSAANSQSSSTAQSKSASDSTAQSSSRSSLKNSGNSRSQSTATGGAATGGQASASASLGNVSPTQTNAQSVGALTATAGSADAAASNGDQEVIVHGDTYEAARIPVATAVAGSTNTTAECRYSVGAGGQGTFLGLSFGLGRKDRDCERLILADRFYDNGNPDAGDVIMCRIRELREAFGADCLEWLRRSRVAAPAQATSHQLQQREAFERGDHLK